MSLVVDSYMSTDSLFHNIYNYIPWLWKKQKLLKLYKVIEFQCKRTKEKVSANQRDCIMLYNFKNTNEVRNVWYTQMNAGSHSLQNVLKT